MTDVLPPPDLPDEPKPAEPEDDFVPFPLGADGLPREPKPEGWLPRYQTDGQQHNPRPSDIGWGDWALDPDKPLTHRHDVICYMMACGATNRQMAVDLGISREWVSRLVNNSKLKERAREIKDQHFGANIGARFQGMVPKALDFAESIITGEEQVKPMERWEATKWLFEKLTGKPKQEVDLGGSVTILDFMRQIDGLREARKGLAEVGVLAESHPEDGGGVYSPPEAPAVDPIDQWVSENVPALDNNAKTEVPPKAEAL